MNSFFLSRGFTCDEIVRTFIEQKSFARTKLLTLTLHVPSTSAVSRLAAAAKRARFVAYATPVSADTPFPKPYMFVFLADELICTPNSMEPVDGDEFIAVLDNDERAAPSADAAAADQPRDLVVSSMSASRESRIATERQAADRYGIRFVPMIDGTVDPMPTVWRTVLLCKDCLNRGLNGFPVLLLDA